MLPPAVPSGLGPGLGSLHLRRSGLRKKQAMLVAYGPDECTLLLHNGRLAVVRTGELPAVEPDQAVAHLPAPRSPIGRMLRTAAAADRGAVALPWTGESLYEHAFSILAVMPGYARPVALDVLALGRPDLLNRCGLSPTETIWIHLVAAARSGDFAGVVSAIAALPLDRYRHKIAILAALLDQARGVPNAPARLAPCLTAFAASEPLAAMAQRALGLVPATAREHIDDLGLRAAAFAAPAAITALIGVTSAAHAEPDARAMLGNRGRLAVLHDAEHLAGELAGTVLLRDAPLAVVDDLIDRGLVTAAVARRSAEEDTYLTARLSPERLTAEQIVELDHRDEVIRRSLISGNLELIGADSERPLGRHAAMVGLLSNKRLEDVSLDQVLPAHRETARHLVAMIRGTEQGQEPASLLHEDLLADRTAWLPLIRIFGTDRLRDASQEPVRRFSGFFEWLGLVAAREHLFLADWRRAADAARSCLELASEEAVRDEAQNLLACALHNLGDHNAALRELDEAIEGGYSVALLANIGVVSGWLDSELAARHLARIVREAPTIAMRANAARQALAAWLGDSTKIWQGEEGERRTLPTVLREPLRSVVVEDIGIEDFRLLLSAMAQFDADWLTAPTSLRGSPHQGTLEMRYYLAMARDGFLPVVEVFATIRGWDDAPEWLVVERDKLVDQTLEYLLEHLNDPDNAAGVIAHALVTKVHGIAPRSEILLVLLAVASLAYHLSNQDGELAPAIVDLFREYQRRVPALDADARELPDELVELCVRRVTINIQGARARALADLIDPYNTALDILDRSDRGSPAWFAARRLVADVVQTCQRTKAELRPWLRELAVPDVRESLMDFLEECADFEAKAQRVLGS